MRIKLPKGRRIRHSKCTCCDFDAHAGGAAAAEPAPSAQLEQAHAAGAVPLSSAAMMSDSVAMTPR